MRTKVSIFFPRYIIDLIYSPIPIIYTHHNINRRKNGNHLLYKDKLMSYNLNEMTGDNK